MVGGEPIRLWNHAGVIRVQRWQRAAGKPHDEHTLCLGHLADGRWFVEQYGGSVVYGTERDARRALAEVMAGSRWYEIPAEYDATHEPVTPGPWVKVGSQWRRPGDLTF